MTSPQQASSYELQLRELIASFSSTISTQANVRVVNSQLLNELSTPHDRFDIKSEVQTGFPYKLSHASSLAELVADLIAPSSPKKGIITDLDDTMWAGILGEVGLEGISWSLDQGTHLHGVYQQFLESLASAGILIAVASKNELELVNRAFERADLRLSKDNIYPLEVHWSRKSESVRRILQVWNLGADDVIFLDDSPMEASEVKDAFPEMECLVFPKSDYEAFWVLLKDLRRAFGKRSVNEEDLIRTRSIREAAALRGVEISSGSPDDFLRSAAASVRVELASGGQDTRAFELVNKTNQFNLNGRRWTQAAWSSYFIDPAAFLMTVAYEDKYGPLGKISAVLGRVDGKTVKIDSWVMSCRAFSRRIEHQTLKQIFEKFRAEEIVFEYLPTPRNAPLREFLMEMLGAEPQPGGSLSFAQFSSRSFEIFQRVEEAVNE